MSRWSRVRPALLALLAFLVVVLAGAPAAVAQPSDSEDDGFENGQTVFVVELDAGGDADWQVVERLALRDEADQTAFDDLATEFESGAFDLASVAALEAAVEAVDSRTDRPMSMSPVDRTAAVEGEGDNRTGTLTASFTWENFARMGETNDTRLYVDDVFVTGGGPWLPGLEPDQELRIQPPDGYGVLDASVPVQDGALHWTGPATFDGETLRATFVGDTNGDGTPPGDDTGDDTGDDATDNSTDDGDGSSLGLLPIFLGGGLVVVLAALLVLYRERGDRWLDRSSADGGTGDDVAADDATDDGVAAGDTTGGADEAVADGTDGTGGATVGVGGQTVNDGDGLDEELLSDEERVERLLEANGGRMKQADIVDETGWSNAKVSQLLSSMAEEDRIDKLRIGRENLISFPDVDVTDIETDE